MSGDVVRWWWKRLENNQMNKQSSGCKGPNTVVHNNNNKEKLKAQDKHGNKVPGVVHASNLVVVVNGEQPTGGQCARHGH